MVDGTTIAIVSTHIKAAADIARALVTIRDTVLVQSKVVELQQVIISAQQAAIAANSEHSELVETIGDLKNQIVKLKDWEAEKQKYELKKYGPILLYAQKEGMEYTEPPHNLCQKCYNSGQKSILTEESRNPGRARVFVCHTCRSDYYVVGSPHPDHFKGR